MNNRIFFPVFALLLVLMFIPACARAAEEIYTAVWIVEPEFKYERLYNCPLCGYTNGTHLLDKSTGQTTFPHGGHGFPNSRGWVYDSELEVYGTLELGMEVTRLTVHPMDEFSTRFPSFTETLQYVREIDSTKVTSRRDEWGFVTSELGEKFTNSKYAIAFGGTILTDFIYDRPADTSVALTYKNLIPVNIDGKWGFVNTNGKIAVPLIYDGIITSDGDIAFVKVEDEWGVLDALASALR